MKDPSPILNALTIDVEDYFMVSAFEGLVPKETWSARESRVEAMTRRLYDLLDAHKTRATFFFLGWVGEKFPGLAKEAAARGHEVACHGYDHRLVYNQTPAEFREDVGRAKKILEDASGARVAGYRAPSFSIVNGTAWALDVLAELGFAYDASLLPARHARGGFAGAPRFPHQRGALWEFPMSVLDMWGKRLPFSGGGYFRLLPYGVLRRGMAQCHAWGEPVITYFHPWEFDPGQPRMAVRGWNRFKHYVNLAETEAKLGRLLEDYSFDTAGNVLARKMRGVPNDGRNML